MSCAIVAIAVLGMLATVALCRRAIGAAYDRIDRVLELSPDGKIENRDTREAKLLHKAQRLRDVYEANAVKYEMELAQVRQSISDMSHQMKTPLAAITMYTDLLLTGALTPQEQADCLRRVRGGADTLHWMMEGLIKLSRLESGAVALKPVNGSTRATIAAAVAGCLALADSRGIGIHVVDFADVNTCHDPRWTQEALTNVLENAIKYSPEGGEIRIRVEPLAMYTRISVANSGPAIPQDEWPRVFQRFFRGSNASGQSGSGLGLYLTRTILEKQGGYVMIDASNAASTSFSLFLQNCKN